MNNIISKVAASVLLAGMAISGVSATSMLTTDGNTSNPSITESFSIDILGAGHDDINLTFIPNINAAPGSGFTLQFQNSGYVETSSIFLCTYADGNESNATQENLTAIVGNMFSKGTVVNGVMSAPKFQFKNDANETLIQDGSHIFFRTDSECMNPPSIVGIGASCLTVSAQVVDGITTQSTAFPDYDTNIRTLGETKRMIRISCQTPVCQIDAGAELKQFTTNSASAGINGDITSGTSVGEDALLSACPECDQTSSCITKIEIENNSSIPLEGIKFTLNFLNEAGAVSNADLKLEDVKITLEDNSTVDYKIDGSTVALTGLGLVATTNDRELAHAITITYTPNGTDVIAAGTVQGRIFDLDTNLSKDGIDVTFDNTQNLAEFKVAGLTEFTVPYMNTNYKTFVKITTQSETPAKLSAVITDQDGKSVDVTLDDIPAKGTVYLFSTFGPLFDAAKTAGLKNAWTVDFTTSGAAVVDSYMTTATGERRVEAFTK